MRVAVILTARPSYAKLRPVIAALVARSVDVQLIVCASALLERYGAVVNVVRKDFPDVPITEVWSTLEGSTLLTSAKETGILLNGLADTLSMWRPDGVLICADRHEVLGAAQAAAYCGVPLFHLQGGESSGSIDDKVRDAITHLADVHCVCTEFARGRVYGLIGDWDQIHLTGCPSIDEAKAALQGPPVTLDELSGVGASINLAQPFITILQHSVTSEVERAADDLDRSIVACLATGFPTVVFWPGQDAGAEAMSKRIRLWDGKIRAVRNLPPQRFLKLLTQTACLIGNSSAGIREASYLGVPVVNVGLRQQNRQRGPNVIDVMAVNGIYPAIAEQIAHGPYPSSTLYGDGAAAARIANVICSGSGSADGTVHGSSSHPAFLEIRRRRSAP